MKEIKKFQSRYNFNGIEPKTFTEKSKVDTLTFIPLEDKIMRFLEDGTQIHADDENLEYDAEETPYQTPDEQMKADMLDSYMKFDPTNTYPQDKGEYAELYKKNASKVEETMQNAKEAGRELAQDIQQQKKSDIKEKRKMQNLAKALSATKGNEQ